MFYLAVPEIQQKRAQKTGKYVIHFHLITNIELDSELIPKRETKTISGADYTGSKRIEYYNLKYWNKGFSIAMPIKRNETFELSKYLIKYLYKDMSDRLFSRQKILHSNNLKAPEFVYVDEYDAVDKLKLENSNNIQEVFRMRYFETDVPFTDYIYKTQPLRELP